jgi:hypothetical protein
MEQTKGFEFDFKRIRTSPMKMASNRTESADGKTRRIK